MNSIIDDIISKNGNTQMTWEEYDYVSSKLGDKNFLVFGTGHDSVLWRESNLKGQTLFLEDNLQWIEPNSSDVLKIKYSCHISQAGNLYREYKEGNTTNFEVPLPDKVTSLNWDFIFIDAPWGGNHGRMQSIYAAHTLITPGQTEIFLHDCDREVERIFGELFFGVEYKELTKLRHWANPLYK